MSAIFQGPFYTATHSAYPFPNVWRLHCGHYHRDEANAQQCMERLNEATGTEAFPNPYEIHRSEAVMPGGIVSGGVPTFCIVD